MPKLTHHMRDIVLAAALIAFGVIARLLPHLPDATPLTAVTIGSALYVNRRFAIVVPLITVALSDILIGFYDWRVMAVVYCSWLLIGLLSLIATRRGMHATALVLVASSLIFFVTTNFAVWAFTPWYAKTFAGLIYCYELGLPFLRNMFFGDVLYTAILLGAFASIRIPTSITRKLAYAH